MDCPYMQICGGCPFREIGIEKYRQMKTEQFFRYIKALNQDNISCGESIFIADRSRRRAEMSFQYQKGELRLGFNAKESHNLVNIDSCLMLTDKINQNLHNIRTFLQEFCQIKVSAKGKNKKIVTTSIHSGEIHITEANNGLDILLKSEITLSLEHRMSICDFANAHDDIARISYKNGNNSPETVLEKNRPYITIGGRQVFIPSGTFLQASDAGEKALVNLVMKYIGESSGKIADLFCGVGTFSYPLSNNIKNKITAIDSSAELLAGFQKSVNAQMIPNIVIEKKNLFKYPLDTQELKGFDIIVFDPPRAGASAQVAEIVKAPNNTKPQKIVAISCNPHTFINDANNLLQGGYKLEEITMVDQFVYSNHMELVALFNKI